MTNYQPYTEASGAQIEIDMDNVTAYEGVALPGGVNFTAVWPIGVFDTPFIITRDPLAFTGDLFALGKTIIPLTQADGSPLNVVLSGSPVAQLITEVSPSLSALYGVESSPWIVQGTPAALAVQLTPPPGPGFTFPGMPFAGCICLGNGTIPPGASFGPISAGPYILGSGDYTFSLGAAPYPPLLAHVTQLQTPPIDIVLGADPNVGPGYCNVQGRVIGGGPWGDWAFMLTLFRIN